MFKLKIASSIAILLSPTLNAANDALKTEILATAKNTAEAIQIDDTSNLLAKETKRVGLKLLNQNVDKAESEIVANTGFTHLDLSIGSDIFGLDSNSTSTKTEAMAVYGIYETSNLFFFNQTSLVNFDDRNTVNFGLGVRHINNAETIITGANAFYDHEFDSGHKRSGFGIEFLTSLLEFRANRYVPITGTRLVDSINEKAMSGYDYKLTANLPYFYSSNLYAKQSKFSGDNGYNVDMKEWGLEAEFFENVTFSVANQDDNDSDGMVASLRFSIPLNPSKNEHKSYQNGNWSANLKPIREKLYKPVQRENRILKSKLKLGVTASGF